MTLAFWLSFANIVPEKHCFFVGKFLMLYQYKRVMSAVVVTSAALLMAAFADSFFSESIAASRDTSKWSMAGSDNAIEAHASAAGQAGSTLTINYLNKQDSTLQPGEIFHIKVSMAQDAHVYCYFEDEKGEVVRFFPNRFQSKSYVHRATPLVLPGDRPFEMTASKKGISERIGCFAAKIDIINYLPSKVVGVDFEALPVKSIHEVKETYQQIKQADISDMVFNIHVHKPDSRY
jgi:hypothetical protein